MAGARANAVYTTTRTTTMIPRVLLSLICLLVVSSCDDKKPSKPKMDEVLSFSWRKSLLDDKTGVVVVENTTSSPVSGLTLELEDQATLNPSTDQDGKTHLYDRRKTHIAAPIPANSKAEFGILETDWLLKADTAITFSLAGYEDKSVFFYNDKNGKLKFAKSYGDKKADQAAEWLHEKLK